MSVSINLPIFLFILSSLGIKMTDKMQLICCRDKNPAFPVAENKKWTETVTEKKLAQVTFVRAQFKLLLPDLALLHFRQILPIEVLFVVLSSGRQS